MIVIFRLPNPLKAQLQENYITQLDALRYGVLTKDLDYIRAQKQLKSYSSPDTLEVLKT